MGDIANENFFDRTLGNLKTAWRDVASGAARTLGLAVPPDAADPDTLTRLMTDCLRARGGEVSARLRAAACSIDAQPLQPVLARVVFRSEQSASE